MANAEFSSATVVRLPGRKPLTKYAQERQSRRERAASRQQAVGAAALGFVAVALTALSLTHLAHGIAIVTGCPTWEAWAMAIGVDLGFVALELARITARDRTMKVVGRHIGVAIIGTLAASAGLNAMAFATAASGWMLAPAIALGLAIPALVYCLTKAGTVMWLDR